jgi:hypothetical protein
MPTAGRPSKARPPTDPSSAPTDDVIDSRLLEGHSTDDLARPAEVFQMRPRRSVLPSETEVRGEVVPTTLGGLRGAYFWDLDQIPSTSVIHRVMAHRVQCDCARLRRRPQHVHLVGWHGGWTSEGIGIFAADIWGLRHTGRARNLGRMSVVVRTPTPTSGRMASVVAC